MAAVHRIRRCDRVRCGDRTLDGLRQRRDDERAAWDGFQQLALVTLRDPVGAERVGELLIEVVIGTRPLRSCETRERFEAAIGA